MRVVRLIDALAMTLLFVATLTGLQSLVERGPRPMSAGQWSVVIAQMAYCVLGVAVMWGWRKRRSWMAPVAWAWAVALTWTGAAATYFFGNADLPAVGAALLAGGIIAAVTVWWITQRNVLAPRAPGGTT